MPARDPVARAVTSRSAELDDAIVWQWWCRNAERQELSPTITDPATIAKVVTLALAGEESEGGGRRAP